MRDEQACAQRPLRHNDVSIKANLKPNGQLVKEICSRRYRLLYRVETVYFTVPLLVLTHLPRGPSQPSSTSHSITLHILAHSHHHPKRVPFLLSIFCRRLLHPLLGISVSLSSVSVNSRAMHSVCDDLLMLVDPLGAK